MKKILAVMAIFLVAIAAGCVGSKNSSTYSTQSGTGTVAVAMKDKPIAGTEVTRIDLLVKSIQVHMDSSVSNNVTENETTNDTRVEDPKWVSVFSGSETINLLEYVNNSAALFGTVNLSSGKYQQIRIYVESATITTSNGTKPLTIPSNVIKIVRGFEIKDNQTTLLTLDWDTDQSIKSTGNGSYKMTPVIKISEDNNIDLSTKTNIKILHGALNANLNSSLKVGV